MDIQQLQLKYQPDDDRVLFRVSFKEQDGTLQEIRSWLTRRLTRNLWPGLVKAMEMQVVLTQPAAAHARAEIVGMGMDMSVSQIRDAGGFNKPFQEAASSSRPLGDEPLLISEARFTVDGWQPLRISFASKDKGNFEVAFTPQMLHGFCDVLRQAVTAAEWDIALRLPGTDMDPASRVLN